VGQKKFMPVTTKRVYKIKRLSQYNTARVILAKTRSYSSQKRLQYIITANK